MPTMSAAYMRDYRAKIAMSKAVERSEGGFLLPFQSAVRFGGESKRQARWGTRLVGSTREW